MKLPLLPILRRCSPVWGALLATLALACSDGGSGTSSGDATSDAGIDAEDASGDALTDASDSGIVDGSPSDASPDTETSDISDSTSDAGADADAGDSQDATSDTAQDGGHEDGSTDTGDSGPDTIAGFDDHATLGVASLGEFFSLATSGSEPEQLKFVLTHFGADTLSQSFYLESDFYALHDEWSWFTLLNGEPIAGWDLEPASGYAFETIAEIYETFEGQANLPLGLTWAGERLYSPDFYADALADDRFFGVGSVLHYPPNAKRALPEELWLFELEYIDKAGEAELTTFFERLAASLPPEIGPNLRWLARSPMQETLAQLIREGGGPYASRMVTYDDLVVEGAVKVYNPGLAAGRIRIVEKGNLSQALLKPYDILVLEEIPDYLPPVAAIITGVPQTPLAHIALLAKARGTPNAHLAGAVDDPQIHDWWYFSKTMALWATEDALLWQEITNDQYAIYKALSESPPIEIALASLDGMPLAVDLASLSLPEGFDLVPVVGGKAAHMATFNDYPDLDSPDLPLGLTVKGYVQHVESLIPTLAAAFAVEDFTTSAQVRFIALEGAKQFVEESADPAKAAQYVASLEALHPPATPLGKLLAAGGARAMVQDKPMDAAYRGALTDLLLAHYSHFDESQGLRFRSSSTAEDVEGFNGAGLYESNTGFLYPEEQNGKDKQKTIELAVKQTWSSAFSFEAFEERRLAGIDHFQARMGVLVHARFDDDKELANGVFTLELVETPGGYHAALTVNVQAGALSVTNPPEGSNALPEVDTVVLPPGAAPQLQRVQPSTEATPGTWLLDDATLLQMATQARQIAIDWLAAANAERDPTLAHTTVTLDFEFRSTAAGWPAVQIGPPYPPRLVWKQVRTLSKPISLPPPYWALPVPTDVLAWVDSGWKQTCTSSTTWAEVVELYTPADQPWPFSYIGTPFVGRAQVYLAQGAAPLGLALGTFLQWTHLDVESVAVLPDSGIRLALTASAAAASGVAAATWSEVGGLTLEGNGGQQWTAPQTSCMREPFATTPSQYLQSLFPGSP